MDSTQITWLIVVILIVSWVLLPYKKKSPKTTRVMVVRRSDDWIAGVEGEVGMFGTGNTHEEALGNLVAKFPGKFKISGFDGNKLDDKGYCKMMSIPTPPPPGT
jgi:hypothetical protein